MTEKSLLAAVQGAAQAGYAEITAAGLKEYRPDLVKEIEAGHDIAAKLAEAKAAGVAEGAKSASTAATIAERERIEAIHMVAFPGQEAVVKALIAEGATPGQAAQELNADYKARGSHLDALKNAEKHVAGLAAAPNAGTGGAPTPPATPQTEDGWKAEYAAAPKLQAEFLTPADYVAFKKNESNIRILGQRAAA